MDNPLDDLQVLRQFIAVAKSGSFSKAAVVLGIAQPILSRRIRALEDGIGMQLFFRNGRGVVLTEAGRILEEHAASILDTASQAASQIQSMRTTPTGEVALGIPPMIGTVLTLPVIERFHASFPHVSLRLIEGFSGYIIEWLTTGRLDVAVLYNVAKTSTLLTDHLFNEDLYLVASANVPPPVDGDVVRLDQLPRIPLILPNFPHGLRSLVNTSLASIGAEPTVALEVDGLSAIKRLTGSGIACTILSKVAVVQDVDAGRLRIWKIVEPDMPAEIVLAMSTQRPSTPVTRALARIVREEAQMLVSTGKWDGAY